MEMVFLYPKQVLTPKQFLTVRRDKKSLYSFVCLPMHLQIGSFVKSSLVWLRTIGDNTQDSVQGWYMYIRILSAGFFIHQTIQKKVSETYCLGKKMIEAPTAMEEVDIKPYTGRTL